jgi:nucleoid-associated protein YgaU
VRLIRNSLRIPGGAALHTVSAALALGMGVACGGGAAAPTPTAVTSAATVAAPPAPSPQRPPLASPAPSPSAAVSSAATSTASTPDVAGSTNYDVQSGDTLASIAQQQYADSTQWRRIYDANKDAIGADPDKLKLGMTLKIPPKATPTP